MKKNGFPLSDLHEIQQRYTKFYALSENEKKKLKFILVNFGEEIFIKIYVPCKF